ncbi:MAG: clostripain-related cysteine peptidase, partial [Candidatus Thermoplasmatota archaeon]|nr:clostripain-related cysteine peptidase [Candidatus Thermoplasmatota archaeon]
MRLTSVIAITAVFVILFASMFAYSNLDNIGDQDRKEKHDDSEAYPDSNINENEEVEDTDDEGNDDGSPPEPPEGNDEGEGGDDGGDGEDNGMPVPPLPEPEPLPDYTWTIMILSGYDNNLATYWESEFAELQDLGPPSGGRFVILVDLDGSNDTQLLVIDGNGTEYLPLSTINPAWGDELNTGDGQVLEEYLVWSMSTFQSDFYHLFTSTHGGAWMGFCPDDTSGGDLIESWEAKEAFAGAKAATGRNIDVLTFFCC